MPETSETYPNDYRLIAESSVRPTIVGGQAVNIWAIAYLLPEDKTLDRSMFASGDLDIIGNSEVLSFLKTLPDWKFQSTPMLNWADVRAATLRKKAADGRHLLVEVLKGVHGLEKRDLDAVAGIEIDGIQYHVLDPIAVLKAKVANVQDLDQVGPPPRHDRQHLKLIARCWNRYLRDLHESALEDQSRVSEVAKAFSRAFATLHKVKVALRAEGIEPLDLMPPELSTSPIEKIRNAYKYQMPLLRREDIRSHCPEDGIEHGPSEGPKP